VELSGGKPKLFVFGGQEITERTEPSEPHSSLTSRIRKLTHI
jgi:hypothetical protein